MDYKIIKTDYLEMVAGGDSDLVRELVSMFREQVSEIYADMKRLLEVKDFQQLGLLAHKAKSSVAIMGMEELAEVLKNFELQAREEKDPEDYELYIARFGEDTRSALVELDVMVSKI